MNIFNLPDNEMNVELKTHFENTTPKQLLNGLKECGYEKEKIVFDINILIEKYKADKYSLDAQQLRFLLDYYMIICEVEDDKRYKK